VDGNDALAVHDATARARERAARGEGPTLLECVTYRVGGHSTSDDPRAYRSPELDRAWRERDPIARLKAFLGRRGLLDEAADARLRGEVREELQRAVREAETYPAKPPVETLFRGVYQEPLWQQREQLEELRRALEEDARVGDQRGEGGGGP
jgi:2-oxoisovalerate dehydrogenase E1 component alpha subunit